MNAHKHITDETLFSLIQKRDEQAIAILLERYKKQFYTYIVILVKDHYIAEDIFQEACIKIIQSIRNDKYKEDGRFVQWASRIIRNMCMDHLKSAKRKLMVTTADGSDVFSFINLNNGEADDKMMKNQFNKRIHLLLDKIPQDQKEIIIMRFFYKLSFKEIAALLDTNVNTAMGRMRYGLIKLRDMMSQMSEAV